MKLSLVIAGLRHTYIESVFRLASYVEDIDRAIQKLRAEHENLSKKLAAIKEGKPYDDPEEKKPGVKLVQVTLEKKDLDIIVDAMQLKQGHIEKYPGLAFQMAFVYLVATFDALLTDIFAAVINSKPAILKSKKQITYDKLLEFGSTTELIDYLAKRELNELSYKSMKEQAEYYVDRFGISLATSGVSVEELIELRSTRNLLVHNNGVVNHLYHEQVPTSSYKIGQHVQV